MTDPTKVSVQFNVKVPWLFKQFLVDKAATERISQNQLAMDAMTKAYGREFREWERSWRKAQGAGS